MGAGAGILYFAGVVVAGLLLLYEHSLVKVDDFSRLDAAFFTMNGVISYLTENCCGGLASGKYNRRKRE